MVRSGILVLGLWVMGVLAHAEMDVVSRNTLIEKLTKLQSELPNSDASRIPVTLRLADLLSERARLDSLEESQKGCSGTCDAGQKDREKAVSLYKMALPSLDASKKPRVLIQMGHVLQLLGKPDEALKYYLQANQTGDQEFKIESDLALGELYFRQRSYQKAEPYFKAILNQSGANSRGLAAYRLAWCWYNLGNLKQAKDQLVMILNTPELLSRQASVSGVDAQFAEEVSIDLSMFMAHLPMTEEDLLSLQKLSPEKVKMNNLVSVAMEASRIGKRAESLLAWNFVLSQLTNPMLKYEAYAQMAQLYFDVSNNQKALESFKSALQVRSTIQQCEGNCAQSDLRLRNLLIAWNRLEKTSPSAKLGEAYLAYIQQFKDPEVAFWSMGAHRYLKDWQNAWDSSGISLMGYANDKKNLEVVLLSRIELAELANNPEWQIQSRADYVQKSVEKSKLAEVKYQIAQFAYDKGNYQAAADEFHQLALDKSVPNQLRIQSAHTALDALVLAKSEDSIGVWAADFAGQFGAQKAAEFKSIQQKAVLNKSARLSELQPEEAYAALNDFDFESADPQEKVIYLKNRILLAEKTKKTTEGLAWSEKLMAVKGLKDEDRELALGKIVYFSDLNLDFLKSLNALEKMKLEQLSAEQRLLKLALYSQLAGLSPDKYLRAYLDLPKALDNKVDIALELVLKSPDAMGELRKLKKHLSSDPQKLLKAYSFAYEQKPTAEVASAILGEKALADSALAQRLKRVQGITEFNVIKEKLAAAALDSQNQKVLTKSIKQRGQLLTQLEAKANRDIQTKDWILQVLSLSLVGKESERFYQELLSLPMPDGLSEEEQGQYMNLLSQQATPYQQKAQAAQSKVKEFWSQPGWQDSLKSALLMNEQKALVENEIKVLAEMADEANRTALNAMSGAPVAAKPTLTPNQQILAEARERVRKEPFNLEALKGLLQLEKQNQNGPMVQYLEGRLGEKL